MILEALINLLMGVVDLIASALGTANAPGWLNGISAQMAELLGYGASMGAWVPWSVFGAALTAVVSCLGLSLAIRIIRIVVSLFTGGGGSAA